LLIQTSLPVPQQQVQPSFIQQQRVHFPSTTWLGFLFQLKSLLIQTSLPVLQQQFQLSFAQQQHVRFLSKSWISFPCPLESLLIQTASPDLQLPLFLLPSADAQFRLPSPVLVSPAAELSQVRLKLFCPSVPVQV